MAMVIASLAHHMGLPEAIMKVASKIARCPKCLSFWVTLAVLILYDCDLIVAIALSVIVRWSLREKRAIPKSVTLILPSLDIMIF